MTLGEPGSATPIAGVRFLDSGRTYFFDPKNLSLDVGDWVVGDTERGPEAGRVVIAPHQIHLSMVQGELKPILWRLGEDDVERITGLQQYGPGDEARLVGGLGRSGRTLYRSSYVSDDAQSATTKAKAEELPVVAGNLSEPGGRHVRGVSIEDERYNRLKSVMPRLGQNVETPEGPGMVVSMHILKALVTVRLDADRTDHLFSAVDLGFGQPEQPLPVAEFDPAALC